MITIKRVYEAPSAADGYRILVDRLWPRGVSKKTAALSEWGKKIAPSPELRKSACHDPERWGEFTALYAEELDAQPDLIARLRGLGSDGTLTLVYASKDPEFNHARILKAYLEAA